jgi:hypothetical protein
VAPEKEPNPPAEDGDQTQVEQGDDAPSLDPAEPDEAKRKRPGWVDVPGTVPKTLMAGNRDAPLFGFHLEGGAVSKRGVQIGFLAEFLDAFRKVFEPLQVLPTGRIPQGNNLPRNDASAPMVSALEAAASVTIFFTLGEEELEIAKKKGNDDLSTLLSVKATGHLGALLSVSPDDDLLDSVSPFGRRIGRSYGQLAHILGENNVKTDWWSDLYGAKEVELSAPDARSLADDLLNKPTTEKRSFTVDGFMWEAATGNAGRRFVRIESHSRSLKASYDIPLTGRVREALSHKVRVKLREIAYYQPYADKPYKREWELLKIIEIGDTGGALAQAEQLKLAGT